MLRYPLVCSAGLSKCSAAHHNFSRDPRDEGAIRWLLLLTFSPTGEIRVCHCNRALATHIKEVGYVPSDFCTARQIQHSLAR